MKRLATIQHDLAESNRLLTDVSRALGNDARSGLGLEVVLLLANASEVVLGAVGGDLGGSRLEALGESALREAEGVVGNSDGEDGGGDNSELHFEGIKRCWLIMGGSVIVQKNECGLIV